MYGCGDFLNDYEGISGCAEYRDDLVLMYLVTLQPKSGQLVRFEMVPFQIKQFRLNYVSKKDAQWLRETMNRECAKFGGNVELSKTDRWTPEKVDSAAASGHSRVVSPNPAERSAVRMPLDETRKFMDTSPGGSDYVVVVPAERARAELQTE